MRKTRKVIADVTASPSPVSPPSTEPNDQQPLCLFCNRAPAKLLDYLHSKERTPIAFCCDVCAASWALTHVKRRLLTWCNIHRQWSEQDGFCAQCWIEDEAARRAAYLKVTGGRADKKGVDSGK